jgi:hypothetical protein
MGVAVNIYPELVEALAADLGIASSPSSPRSSRAISPAEALAASTPRSAIGNISGAWLALALIWYVRHERSHRGARAYV